MTSMWKASLGIPAPFKISQSSKTTKYPAGRTIVTQGDCCSELYYIQDGIVKLTTVSKRGRGAVLGILGQGDFFGKGCILGRGTHSASAVALVATTAVAIKRETMLRLLEEEKSVSSQFLN